MRIKTNNRLCKVYDLDEYDAAFPEVSIKDFNGIEVPCWLIVKGDLSAEEGHYIWNSWRTSHEKPRYLQEGFYTLELAEKVENPAQAVEFLSTFL